MYKGRTKFVATKGDYILSFSVFIFFTILFVTTYYQEGLNWMTVVTFLFLLIGIGGIIETYTSYLILGDNELTMRKTFKKFIIKRIDIDQVPNEKGCSLMLVLHNGEKIDITEIGESGKANSIRAWLRASKK